MNLFIPAFIFFFLSTAAVAQSARNQPLVIKKVYPDGLQIVFSRREGDPPWNGITIKDPQTKGLLYDIKVTKCSPAACLGTVVKNYSGIKIRSDENYVHSYNDGPISNSKPMTPPPVETPAPKLSGPVTLPEASPIIAPPVEPPPVVIQAPIEKPMPKVKPPKKEETKAKQIVKKEKKNRDRSAFIGYGTPIGPGFKLGYYWNSIDVLKGFNYSNIGSETNKTKISGHVFSASYHQNVFKFTPSLKVNLTGELGVAKVTLDFKGIDAGGPIEEEMTYLLGVGAELIYQFTNLSLGLKGGLSKSGLKEAYTNEFGDYINPYGQVLSFVEFGAYYRF